MSFDDPQALESVQCYKPLLDALAGRFYTPKQLAARWAYTEDHLSNMRRLGKGPGFIRLSTGGVRYPVAEVLAHEIAGADGRLTVARVNLALSACAALTPEQRQKAQEFIAHAFPNC